MKEVLIDTLLDGIRMLPFLLAAYLLIEWIEHRSNDKMKRILINSGRYGPLGGAVLGAIPQCGFSVAAANFYSERVITKGTLLAVFLSTSDEAIPVLLAAPKSGNILLKLIAIKIVIGFFAGFLVDLIERKTKRSFDWIQSDKYKSPENCHCERGILSAALYHTVTIFLFILTVSFLLNTMFYYVGKESVSAFLMTDSLFQPLLTGLFGLIPNCAVSLVLTQLFLAGNISFGSIVAGLCTGAGIGFAVLLKANRKFKENINITVLLYIIGAGSGILIDIFMSNMNVI
ncbi:putative manganese transporter [Sinanaerobacter sp. ZZT-01]|uniref:putative manganese transporter n=1 Tax=Sinanaerobacter sp. ZZT-01 TaxID=3111540 RepID=UPI002D78874A|nr:putative manganese transporter [Sinanaerobacter sp. ZZT-01]WRR92132.1 putative manganese transporter [Sinanaerobacter sp. ZZT-01]